MRLDLGDLVKVSISQFHGIEINDFAVAVAKTALWIAENQMLRETEAIAHRTFRWDSESNSKAHVHCVVVGFSCDEESRAKSAKSAKDDDDGTSRTSRTSREDKLLFDGDRVSLVPHINAYLLPAPDVFVEPRREALSADRPLVFGSMPNDGGFLSDWSPERRAEILAKWPEAGPLFRRLTGSQEYINGIERWCLWLKDASPALIRAVPPVMEAVAAVRELRLACKRAATRKLADTPMLFGEIRQPELVIPAIRSRTSTTKRPCRLTSARRIKTTTAPSWRHTASSWA